MLVFQKMMSYNLISTSNKLNHSNETLGAQYAERGMTSTLEPDLGNASAGKWKMYFLMRQNLFVYSRQTTSIQKWFFFQ